MRTTVVALVWHGHAARVLWKGGLQMNADRKKPAAQSEEARANRSRRIQAFLHRWAQRHMPDRVTRFSSR